MRVLIAEWNQLERDKCVTGEQMFVCLPVRVHVCVCVDAKDIPNDVQHTPAS